MSIQINITMERKPMDKLLIEAISAVAVAIAIPIILFFWHDIMRLANG